MSDLGAADLFAGAGGTSTGLARACQKLSRTPDLVAVNHWDIAIETHRRNHPWARHLCTGLDNIHPGLAVPRGRLDLLVASPECIHHSLARGGKPMCDQSRSSPWLVVKWLQDLYVNSVLIENVPEFRSWGPLGSDGRPLKSKKGASFESFVATLKSLGYNVEWRVLNAADYGDATVRERLYIQAKRGHDKKIFWPDKTHSRMPDQHEMFGGDRKRWRPARDIIDWTIPSQSIFHRKRPLAPATHERIAAGLKKFCGTYAEPFLVVLRRHMEGRSLDQPVPTLTAGGQHIGLCQPFVLGQQSGAKARSTENPLPTIATGGAISLTQPFIVPQFGERNGQRPRNHSVDAPLPTVTSHGAGALVEPFIAEYRGNHAGREDGHRRVRSVQEPLATQDTSNRFGLVQPFVTSAEHKQPFVTTVNHGAGDGSRRNYDVENPMPTITTVDAWGLVEPFVLKYYGTADAASIEEPLATVTARDRFGLVELDGLLLDIHFRMLHWRELAAAQGFPSDYDFAGTREQIVKQIGNAVPVNQAEALCRMLVRG